MKKHHLTLTAAEREQLQALLAAGSLPVKTFTRATALLELDSGKSLAAVATTRDVTSVSVATWHDKYRSAGFACLHDAPLRSPDCH
jgi:hypothetical protein